MAINSKFLVGKGKSLLAPSNAITKTQYTNGVLTTINSIYASEDRTTVPGRDLAIADPAPKPMSLSVTNLIDVSSTIGDAASLSDWNDFFQTEIYADTVFTSINIVGTEIQLFGATNLSLRAGLFSPGKSGYDWIVSIDDQTGCIVDIGDIVFNQCINLEQLNLPSVKRFGFETFYNCDSLSVVSAPSLLEISDYAFDSCDGIINLSFPQCLHVSQNAFYGCASLESISLPKLISIDGSAFYNCSAIVSISMPSVLSIGGIDIYNSQAFFGITGNTISLTIPKRLTTCNYGDPQPDIQYLIDNNTVTITTV